MLGSLIFSNLFCSDDCRHRSAALSLRPRAGGDRLLFAHKALRARYSLTTRAMVRYCVGAMPTWDEKKCVKWLCDEKPSSKPISVTEI